MSHPFWSHENVTIWVREGFQKNKKLDFHQSSSKSFFVIFDRTEFEAFRAIFAPQFREFSYR